MTNSSALLFKCGIILAPVADGFCVAPNSFGSQHDLRRTFASTLLDAGQDLSAVSGLLGHASVQTTVGYDKRPERARKEASQHVHLPRVVWRKAVR